MRCFSVASMSTPLQWPVIFTRDHKRLLVGLDIHISATAGTQEPKCLELSAGREEEGDEVGHPVQSLAGKTYRHRSALRPRHVGIQNVETKDYPANHTHSFAMLQPCPLLYLWSRMMFFSPETSSLLPSPRSSPGTQTDLQRQTLPATWDISWHFVALPVELCPFGASLLRQAVPPDGKCICYCHEWLWQETSWDYFDVVKYVLLQGKEWGKRIFLPLK